MRPNLLSIGSPAQSMAPKSRWAEGEVGDQAAVLVGPAADTYAIFVQA